MDFKTLLLTQHSPHILQVTLNRPERRNAINIDMMHELLAFWQSPLHDIRCIILTGSENTFCAGADLKDRRDMTLDVWRAQHVVLQQAMLAMLAYPVPIIAAVNGAAFGGGLELTLASDFAYAANTAIFSQSEVKIGIMPGALGTQTLPRVCGLQRAKELAFTAQSFSAHDAFAWGIVNKICEPDQLLQEVLITANKISQNAPLSVQHVKQAINMSQQLDLTAGYQLEVKLYNTLLDTQDRAEGINAFNEKRQPHFQGK